MKKEMDPIDLQIISLLLEDAYITNKEIAEIVFRSESTICLRKKRLRENGIIIGSTILLSYDEKARNKPEENFHFIIELSIDYSDDTIIKKFDSDISKINGIRGRRRCTDSLNTKLEVFAKDKEAFLAIERKVASLENTKSVQSSIILEDIIIRNNTAGYQR